MNKYGLPLAAPLAQTLIPAMNQSGIIYGFYPITKTTFDGTETSFALSDTTIPLTTVTVDTEPHVPQYMAAVFPLGIADNYKPWASVNLITPWDGYSRMWRMPTQTWMLSATNGALITALTSNLAGQVTTTPAPSAPSMTTPQTLNFKGSVSYAGLTGDCPFFEFNWVTLFSSMSADTPLRIVPVTNPAGLKATVVGVPTATANGTVLYDTIRVTRVADALVPGDYEFVFQVFATNGLSTTVNLTVTVV